MAEPSIAAFLRSRDQLRAVFADAASRRAERPELVADDAGGTECAWVGYERTQMLTEVNRQRADRGQLPATEAAVTRVEREACGHADYASKYALYCAEIVSGTRSAETGAPA